MQAGLDEAGVGSLMGDMVAAAVVLYPDFDTFGIKDSKKMTEKSRAKMYELIMKNAYVGVGIINNSEIDSLGMAKCRRLVFHRALDNLPILPDSLIVDGTLFENYKNIPFQCIPQADNKYFCVSAASIIAKHTRDTMIIKLCDDNPELSEKYNWKKNKGYCTKEHQQRIKEYGPCKHIHRMSFEPCKSYV